jgi:hypothetical protein
MFAVTPAVATASRQWLKSSGLITVVRATFHLCPLMRIGLYQPKTVISLAKNVFS